MSSKEDGAAVKARLAVANMLLAAGLSAAFAIAFAMRLYSVLRYGAGGADERAVRTHACRIRVVERAPARNPTSAPLSTLHQFHV
jgi:hypothetical protein